MIPNSNIPDFFMKDYKLLLDNERGIFDQEFRYSSPYVSVIRYEYYEHFFNSPIDKKLFKAGLRNLMSIFETIYTMYDFTIVQSDQQKIKHEMSKEIFLKLIKYAFNNPSKLHLIIIKKINTVLCINHDLSIVIFYEYYSDDIKKIISIFQNKGMSLIE